MFKKDGLLEGLRAGMIVADATTAEPTSTMKVAAAVIEAGARFADIPLIRTPKEAEAGTLGVMVGSDAALLAELKPVLETFANAIFHAGTARRRAQAEADQQLYRPGRRRCRRGRHRHRQEGGRRSQGADRHRTIRAAPTA